MEPKTKVIFELTILHNICQWSVYHLEKSIYYRKPKFTQKKAYSKIISGGEDMAGGI